MKLICDMGESYGQWQMGNDEAVMPYIDIACIACGYHAGDPDIMTKTIGLALKHNVDIGAHPSYLDIQGFGRRSMLLTPEQIENIVGYQLGALTQLCKQQGANISYLKPHGALYHDMLNNDDIFQAILNVIKKSEKNLTLIGQFLNKHQVLAELLNITLCLESFADRAYQNNGKLVPREQPNAVLNNANAVLKQLDNLFYKQSVNTINNHCIQINTDAVCIHGDNAASIEAIQIWKNRN